MARIRSRTKNLWGKKLLDPKYNKAKNPQCCLLSPFHCSLVPFCILLCLIVFSLKDVLFAVPVGELPLGGKTRSRKPHRGAHPQKLSANFIDDLLLVAPESKVDPKVERIVTAKLLHSTNKLSDGELEMRCPSTKGVISISLNPGTAPRSIERILLMLELDFFDQGIAFFRVNDDAIQFGAYKHPKDESDRLWPLKKKLDPQDTNPWPKEERRKHTWKRGDFALIGETQMIICRRDGTMMGINDQDVVAGTISEANMASVLDQLDRSYGNDLDTGTGPNQVKIFYEGMDYIKREFPKTDYIKSCYLT